MVKLINAQTGTVMYVHESRLEEYLARGHKLAPAPPPPPRPKRTRTKTVKPTAPVSE